MAKAIAKVLEESTIEIFKEEGRMIT